MSKTQLDLDFEAQTLDYVIMIYDLDSKLTEKEVESRLNGLLKQVTNGDKE